jgi:hypothetical protein
MKKMLINVAHVGEKVTEYRRYRWKILKGINQQIGTSANCKMILVSVVKT